MIEMASGVVAAPAHTHTSTCTHAQTVKRCKQHQPQVVMATSKECRGAHCLHDSSLKASGAREAPSLQLMKKYDLVNPDSLMAAISCS